MSFRVEPWGPAFGLLTPPDVHVRPQRNRQGRPGAPSLLGVRTQVQDPREDLPEYADTGVSSASHSANAQSMRALGLALPGTTGG